MGIEEVRGLLDASCQYKNVQDAEHLLLCNEPTFLCETKSFIIFNGWSNLMLNLRESKRFLVKQWVWEGLRTHFLR